MKEPRINVYLCEFGCHNITVDVDHGVTPFSIKCRAKPRPDRPIHKKYLDKHGECCGNARSCFYPSGPKPPNIKEPTLEWFKPTSENDIKSIADRYGASVEEVKKEIKENPNMLWLRDRTNKEPIYHEESVG